MSLKFPVFILKSSLPILKRRSTGALDGIDVFSRRNIFCLIKGESFRPHKLVEEVSSSSSSSSPSSDACSRETLSAVEGAPHSSSSRSYIARSFCCSSIQANINLGFTPAVKRSSSDFKFSDNLRRNNRY